MKISSRAQDFSSKTFENFVIDLVRKDATKVFVKSSLSREVLLFLCEPQGRTGHCGNAAIATRLEYLFFVDLGKKIGWAPPVSPS
jgi:hypothetical protein